MKNTFPNLCGSLAGSASDLGVKMHNAGYEAEDLDYTYVAMASENLEDALETIRGMGFRGVGVSMPFKEKIIPHLDEVNEDVEEIGACNPVVFEDGNMTGYNTDWRGAVNALKETSDLDVEKAEIIGAGGVARAIAYGLRKEGIEVHVSARSESQREQLVKEMDLAGGTELEEQGNAGAELVVNATPVAELPESPVNLENHENGGWLLDVVFTDIKTDIVEKAEAKGWKATRGWRMLLHQGLEQFEMYTGEEGPEEAMGKVLKNGLKSS